MKQNIRLTRQLLSVITAGIVVAGFAGAASAAGTNANVDAGIKAGGKAGTHMGATGTTNTNAQWQSGEAKGDARAAVRMNAKGAEMKQSGDAQLEAATPAKRKP